MAAALGFDSVNMRAKLSSVMARMPRTEDLHESCEMIRYWASFDMQTPAMNQRSGVLTNKVSTYQ